MKGIRYLPVKNRLDDNKDMLQFLSINEKGYTERFEISYGDFKKELLNDLKKN